MTAITSRTPPPATNDTGGGNGPPPSQTQGAQHGAGDTGRHLGRLSDDSRCLDGPELFRGQSVERSSEKLASPLHYLAIGAQGGLRRAVALRPRTPAGYLTRVISVDGGVRVGGAATGTAAGRPPATKPAGWKPGRAETSLTAPFTTARPVRDAGNQNG